MSEIIRFNTEQEASTSLVKEIKPYSLVGQDNPILQEVMPEFVFDGTVDANDLASRLVETCIQNRGIGLSANQCGLRHRVFVMGAGDDYVAFFNPKVLESKGEVHMLEGCLSFPLLGLRISRSEEILVEYQDFRGEKHTARFNGISARCFLHELDHMNGILYTSLAKPLALKSGYNKLQKTIKRMANVKSFMKPVNNVQK